MPHKNKDFDLHIAADIKIDLHGLTSMAAFYKVIDVVLSVHKDGGGNILFITGIGNAEKGTGVIRQEFPIWLEHFKIADFIVSNRYNAGCYLVKVR
jgi:DNA-nicking Smr family endonuclease